MFHIPSRYPQPALAAHITYISSWSIFLYFRSYFHTTITTCINCVQYYFQLEALNSQKITSANETIIDIPPVTQILWHAKNKRIYGIGNIQPIKTDPLSRVLRMISEAGGSTNYPSDPPKEKYEWLFLS